MSSHGLHPPEQHLRPHMLLMHTIKPFCKVQHGSAGYPGCHACEHLQDMRKSDLLWCIRFGREAAGRRAQCVDALQGGLLGGRQCAAAGRGRERQRVLRPPSPPNHLVSRGLRFLGFHLKQKPQSVCRRWARPSASACTASSQPLRPPGRWEQLGLVSLLSCFPDVFHS